MASHHCVRQGEALRAGGLEAGNLAEADGSLAVPGPHQGIVAGEVVEQAVLAHCRSLDGERTQVRDGARGVGPHGGGKLGSHDLPSLPPGNMRRGARVAPLTRRVAAGRFPLAAELCNNETVSRASLEKRPEEVQAMFDDVAPRYDAMNDILSMGQTRRWRKIVVDAVGAKRGQRVLDLAAGTGTSSEPYADAGIGVVACDFSQGMLKVGKRRRPDIDFVAGDATNLPFADNSFDASTISFGLRNVNEPKKALAEMLRVTKPGGTLVVAEFSHPTFAPFRTVYTEYLMRALPPGGQEAFLQSRRLRLPGRVHPRLARPGRPGRLDRGRRLGILPLPQPHRRHRCGAPSHQTPGCATANRAAPRHPIRRDPRAKACPRGVWR